MLRFAILEHAWQGIHWDFLLESEPGGPLRTWAIDEPIRPGLVLPARALPDHRREYLDYEGPVSGGRGEVRRVDRGAYARKVWAADRVVVDLAGADFRGEVELVRITPPDQSATPDPGGRWAFRLGKAI